MPSFLDANFAEHETFERLAIGIKNLLIQGETEDKNHEYETQGTKLPNLKMELWEENHELSKMIGEKTSQFKDK